MLLQNSKVTITEKKSINYNALGKVIGINNFGIVIEFQENNTIVTRMLGGNILLLIIIHTYC